MSIPLPSALVRAPVTWTLGHADTTGPLKAARGFVRFEASAIAVAYSDRTVLPSPVETPFVAGVMTPVDLIVNDPDIWNWKVTVKAGGVTWDPFHINVPTEGTNLASASITPGKGPVRVLKGDQGFQGKSLTRMVQVTDELLRADLADPATGEAETEYFDLPRGPEGPFGGTTVTDPQVASYIGAPTETTTALDRGYRRGISVLEYGADPGGVADSTLAFQAALDAAGSTTSARSIGIAVFVPAGEYRITSTVTVPENIMLRGDGQRSSLIQYEGTGTAIRVLRRTVVEDLWVRGTGGTASVGIAADGPSYSSVLVVIRRVSCTMLGVGVLIDQNYLVSVADTQLGSCDIGLLMSAPDLNGISVTGGYIQGNRVGIEQRGYTANKVRVVETNIEQNTDAGIRIYGGSLGFMIRGCYFEGYGDGPHVSIEDPGENARPRSGVIENNLFLGSKVGIDAVVTSNLKVQNNMFTGTSVPMWFGPGVNDTTFIKNIYGAVAFDPAVHYAGNGLEMFEQQIRVERNIQISDVGIMTGSGWPETSTPAPPGSLYLRSNGVMYFKKTGTGKTGWVTVTLGSAP